MSANTSPDNIVYPVSTDNVAPLETVFANMATSTQDALNSRAIKGYRWADSAARGAQTGMTVGDLGFQADNGYTYRYSGSAWSLWSVPRTTFTPSWTNFTPSGTNTGEYEVSAGRLTLQFISIGAVTASNPQFAPPITATDSGSLLTVGATPFGSATLRDESATSNYPAVLVRGSSSTIRVFHAVSPLAQVTATVPFTWASADQIYGQASYRVD